MASSAIPKTHLAYHYDADLHEADAIVQSVQPITQLSEANRALFKQTTADGEGEEEEDFIVITDATIFHPQGGGQPSDVGTMTAAALGDLSTTTTTTTFTVTAARADAEHLGLVLHLGRFSDASKPLQVGTTVTQKLDSAKRDYYSRLHTAGHVLGASVRHLLQNQIPGFDELKASHFPDAAACEFQGSIGGEHKADIQRRVDEYLAQAMAVEIEWWDAEDFRREGLERLIPEPLRDEQTWGEKLRVVRIVGAEVYPCGGTHVKTTDKCGKTTVKKISRSKGNSRVSYTVAE